MSVTKRLMSSVIYDMDFKVLHCVVTCCFMLLYFKRFINILNTCFVSYESELTLGNLFRAGDSDNLYC